MSNTYQPSKRKTWFNLKEVESDTLDVYIFDEIGMWGVSAKDFITSILSNKFKSLNIFINSPGGDVFDGLAIYNFLNRLEQKVTIHVDGIGASIASIICMAGDEIIMPENAMLWIHNPWTMTMGNASDLTKEAEALLKMQDALVNIYATRTGQSTNKIQQLMDEETWLTADECLSMGFCDHVGDAVKMVAKYDPSLYSHIPSAMRMKLSEESEESENKMEDQIEKTEEVEVKAEATENTEIVEEVEVVEEVKSEEVEQVVEEVVVAEQVEQDPRAEAKLFIGRFGAELGVQYFAKGLSLADAEREFTDSLIKENAELKKQLNVVAKPVATKTTDVTAPQDFESQYKNAKTPAEKRAIYKKHFGK